MATWMDGAEPGPHSVIVQARNFDIYQSERLLIPMWKVSYALGEYLPTNEGFGEVTIMSRLAEVT